MADVLITKNDLQVKIDYLRKNKQNLIELQYGNADLAIAIHHIDKAIDGLKARMLRANESALNLHAIDRLIDMYGVGQLVHLKVGNQWNNKNCQREFWLSEFRSYLIDLGMDTAGLHAYRGHEAGDAILIDHEGKVIIKLA